MAPTHEVSNQVDELRDFNLYATDPGLLRAVQQAGADRYAPALLAQGAELGRSATFDLAAAADRRPPELRQFDSRGRRIDRVDFDPAWHALLALYRRQGLVSLPYRDTGRGRWSAFAAGFYLHGQVQAGTLCPATMTLASIGVLQHEPALFDVLRDKLFADAYDARDLPIAQKASIWIGMGMTEKQGGSDVRSNTTRATRSAATDSEYTLVGHKWFYSVPTSDAHLVVAQTGAGPSCFFVPRWRPDGSRNAVRLQRLKDKVGNRSNASGEVEFEDAWGVLLGEAGRGIPTIIEMATVTRLCCVIGSAALVRQALVQALHYARLRVAFGKPLRAHPLMRSVLTDLALESAAALVLAMRLAEAFEQPDAPGQRAWLRIMTPAAKFWVCKRAVEASGEAMEVFGGNGYVGDEIVARIYREAPVNSIWEGSGNVMCLDVLRAVAREPEAARMLLDELRAMAPGEPAVGREVQALNTALAAPAALEAGARLFVQRLVLVAQAGLLRRRSPAAIADAFIATRLGGASAPRVFGAIDAACVDSEAVLADAFGG